MSRAGDVHRQVVVLALGDRTLLHLEDVLRLRRRERRRHVGGRVLVLRLKLHLVQHFGEGRRRVEVARARECGGARLVTGRDAA